MRAALITGARQVEILEFDDPTPTDDGVVVDVAYCGLCGTDIQAFTTGRPYKPAVCGHEWTGTLSAVGPSVSRFREGDRVVVGVPPACGTCEICRAGHIGSCATVAAFARGRDPEAPPHGGFAPRIAVNVGRVIAAHPALDDETLAQVEPVTVSLHGVHQSGLRATETAVIQGAGAIGLTTMQIANAAGAGQTIVIEPDEGRRTLATSLGATAVATPDEADDTILDLTGGLGADVVFECAGATDTMQSAVDLTRRGGSVCLLAFTGDESTVETGSWLRKEISITTALAYVHEEFETAMDLLADGRVRVAPLHTSTTKLDGLAETLEELASGRLTQTKVLVNPNW